jgi:O-antigen ligase
MPLAMYWIASRCTLDENAHRWILGFFTLFGLYLSLTAICEVAGLTAIILPTYIASPEHLEFLGRARGPFLNPVGNGMYMVAALLVTLMLWPLVHNRYRPLVLGLAAIHCIGAVATMTRSVWLGLACAVVGLATLIVPRQHRFRVLLVACLLGGAVLAVKGRSFAEFKRDKNVSSAEMAQSAKLRPILAAYAYEIFSDHPWTGCGFGQYKQVNMDYLTTRSFDLPMDKGKTYVQHNVFLSLLAETGIIGVGLFVLVLSLWMADGWTLWYDNQRQLWERQLGLCSFLLLVAYLPNGMFHEMSLIPMLNMLVFFFAGITRGILNQGAPCKGAVGPIAPNRL